MDEIVWLSLLVCGEVVRSNEWQKMGRKPREMKVVLTAHYVPLPPEMVAVCRAGLLLLWQIIKAEIAKEANHAEESVNDMEVT